MKTLCFALILNALSNGEERASPPTHIQDLMKKRILFQLKQQNPDLQFFFDDATCNVVGTYNYTGEAMQIKSNDKSLDLELAYNDILDGKKLELSQVSTAIETKQNVIAAGASANLFPDLSQSSNGGNVFSESPKSSASGIKKWLPWIVGVVAVGVGGWAIYNTVDRSRSNGNDSGDSARRRGRR